MLATVHSKKTGLWYYNHSSDDRYRYTLGVPGKNPLVCFGINPSTARPDDLDRTLKQVQGRAEDGDKFDGWIMLNLFPLRETKPQNLPEFANMEEIQKNIKIISEVLHLFDKSTVWAAWGGSIDKRKYLPQCLREIYQTIRDIDLNWVAMKESKKTGHPHHPLYLKHDEVFHHFDLDKYIQVKKY